MVAIERTLLFDVQQAARRLHVSPQTIRRRIRDGSLEAFRVGESGGIRIPAANVDALLVRVEPKEHA